MAAGCRLNTAVEGRAYAPLSSRIYAARLARRCSAAPEETGPLTGCQAEVLDSEGRVLAAAALTELRIDARLGRQPRRLEFPDGTVFETEDHAAIEALTGPVRGSWLHAMEQFRPRLIAVAAAALAGIWLIWRYGLDMLVAAAVMITPAVAVQQIDSGMVQTIDYALAEPTGLSKQEQARVTEVFETLLAHAGEPPKGAGFQLLFRDMPGMGPNALALPGGTVVMTDAFVEQFPDEDVLAGVLGHEIGHVAEQHGLKQLYRSIGLYVVVAFLAGETGPLMEDVLLEGNVLLSLRYGRGHEASADSYGVRLADRAGYDPEGLKRFFAEVQGQAGEPPEWLSSHPNHATRLEAIDGHIRALGR